MRISALFGIGIMVLYWMAHMDFPFISDTNNFFVDEHVIFFFADVRVVSALVLGLLIATRAGHILGLEEWAARQEHRPSQQVARLGQRLIATA